MTTVPHLGIITHRTCATYVGCFRARPNPLLSDDLLSVTVETAVGVCRQMAGGHRPRARPPAEPLTRVAWLAARAEGPIMMLTLLDDWVSLVLPPSAAERPEMTRALEKLRLPKRKLRVELVDEPRLDLMSASARSRTLRWPVVVTGGGCECRDAAEVCKDSRLPESLGASPWTDEDVCRKAWWLSKIGPDELRMAGLWLNAPWACTD